MHNQPNDTNKHRVWQKQSQRKFNGKYNADVIPTGIKVYGSTTRGNMFKLDKGRAKYDLRKYYFINRVVNAWNSLPDHVVLSDTTDTFKSRLDKFWKHQDMIYGFQAELHKTWSHSS